MELQPKARRIEELAHSLPTDFAPFTDKDDLVYAFVLCCKLGQYSP
jgi:hypothetical protein